jgi:hypothetical protein
MAKFVIAWDCGYGSKDARVVEAVDHDAAQKLAYDAWRDSAENNADYEAVPYSEDACDKYDLEYDGTSQDQADQTKQET